MKIILVIFLFIYGASCRPEDPVEQKQVGSAGAPQGDVILQRLTKSVGHGTGLFWWEERNSMLYCDSNNATIHLWNYGNGKTTSVYLDLEEQLAFKIPLVGNETGGIIGSDNKIRLINVKDDGSHTLSEVEAQIPDKGYTFCKGHCDSKGNLYALATNLASQRANGIMYKITKSEGIKKIHEFTGRALDFAFNPKDNKKLYVTTGKKVFSYDFDMDKGTLSNEAKFFEAEDPCIMKINSLDVDLDDNLWMVVVSLPGQLYKINPKTKKIVKTIMFPHNVPNQLTWGGYMSKNLLVGFEKTDSGCDNQSGDNMIVAGLKNAGKADNLCNYK